MPSVAKRRVMQTLQRDLETRKRQFNRAPANRIFFGRVCRVHPGLFGQRWRVTGQCIGCERSSKRVN
jgi:hypothetical protein